MLENDARLADIQARASLLAKALSPGSLWALGKGTHEGLARASELDRPELEVMMKAINAEMLERGTVEFEAKG